MTKSTDDHVNHSRADTTHGGAAGSMAQRALWAGIAFSFGFTGLIWLLGGRLDAVEHLPDAGASWYYWKLPSQTFAGRFSAWGLYLAHQIAIWWLIYSAQQRQPGYTTGLHRENVLALGVNAFFIVLHLLQTHLWYDGLAQNVSIFSSQGSVIVLLVMVFIMENPRRGLFFGRRAPLPQRAVRGLRKYHGYFFAWAIIYTFWFHPAEATLGHLIGFLYTFLLMVQGSLFFTRVHLDRRWTFTQEILVLIHGTLVAVMQGQGLWPMFLFGFAGLFVITQMHGLGLGRGWRTFFLGSYLAGVLYVYNGRGWDRLEEVFRIPVIDYLGVFVLALLVSGAMWAVERMRGIWIGRGVNF